MQESKFLIGRPWFGGSTKTLVGICVIGGLILSNGLGGLVLWSHQPTYAVAAYLSAALGLSPLFMMVVWLVIVEPGSIRLAGEPTEDSVENLWDKRAGSGAFRAMYVIGVAFRAMYVIGVAFWLVLIVTESELGAATAVASLVIVGGIFYSLYYWSMKRQDA